LSSRRWYDRLTAPFGVQATTGRVARWLAVDWAVALYAVFVAVVDVTWSSSIPKWAHILVSHGLLVAALVMLPPRGAQWERPQPEDPRWLTNARATVRFLRYTYPALLLTPFFEEVSFTVNAVTPGSPYWFEPYLYAADRALFGSTPAVTLSQSGAPVLDEVMHAFYFSYYPLLISGIVIAWTGATRRCETPAPGFDTALTCMMLGFFLSYVWYPFLPARGPWENAALMAHLRPFHGWLFTDVIGLIIAGGAVSGGCFPSAHISGTWALTFGLCARHRKAALWFGLVAVGLSVSCVYTRYHHAVDVFAGLAVAAVAATIGFRVSGERGKPCRSGLPLGSRV